MPKMYLLFLMLAMKGSVCFAQDIPTADTSKVISSRSNVKAVSDKVAAKATLGIYPNPARNKVTLRVSDFKPGMCAVRILDTKGKMMKEERRLLVTGTEDIVVFLMLNPGIYFIDVSEPGRTARKKLVLL